MTKTVSRLKLIPLQPKHLETIRVWRNRDRFAFADSTYISIKKQSALV